MTKKTPFIKVTWKDVPENFTEEKIKRVKSYFQKKYQATTVKIITKSINYEKDTKLKTLDINDNILDLNHQKNLMKEFIKENNIETNWDKLNRLDNRVNENIILKNQNKIKYNKWVIKRIEFSNFLSYGQNNCIDFTNLNGITVIESTPKNFGGKSTATVDLLLFLFFNSTTKTKTNIEIFNKFTDNDEVIVKGHIIIDNENYIIERKLIRKKSKSGEFNVTSKLEFFKIDDNGNQINLNGEQRRETETYITSAIGSEEDFLTTILTTGYNLEQLIESKPTARGLILTKFMGLDSLKQKEDIAKEIYNDWSKKLISNLHNITDLTSQIEDYTNNLNNSKNLLTEKKNLLNDKELSLSKFEKEKESYQLKRNNDIDVSLIKINTEFLQKEIDALEKVKSGLQQTLKSVIVEEPKEYYLEDVYDAKNKELYDIKILQQETLNKIKDKNNLIEQLKNKTICPACNRKLENIDYSKEINDLMKEIQELNKIDFTKLLDKATEALENYKLLKQQFDTYEKNKLLKTRYELQIEQKKLEIKNKKNEISNYENNQKKLDENKKIDAKLISLKTQLDTINGEIKTLNSEINNLNFNISLYKEKIETSNELIKKIKIEEETIVIFKTYFSIYGKNGISKAILKNTIPLLNAELYRLLVDSCHFILELNMNDKNEVEFIMIDTETRVVKPLSSGSGYERTISSLALRSVLTKISNLPKPNIIVMDEVFGKIADENLEMVGEFFKKIKSYFEHIILISHNPLIRNWSDNVVIIIKENNISRIDYNIT